MQSTLSEIRTDLDSFSDIEAYALMYSAYMQTRHELLKSKDAVADIGNWNFLNVKDSLTIPAQAEKAKKNLKAGSQIAFKAVAVSFPAKLIIAVIVLLFLAPIGWAVYANWNEKVIEIDYTVKAIVGVAALSVFGYFFKTFAKFINPKSVIEKYARLVFLMITGFIVSNMYLWIFNPLYNRAGKVKTKS